MAQTKSAGARYIQV